MQITLTNTGKRYNREWIFRHVDFTFEEAKTYAITGSNGSGKSTLLQVLAGAIQHSEGIIEYKNGKMIEPAEAYKYFSIATPYLELVEEMTATELLEFHNSFKPLFLPINKILEEVTLQKAAHKQIRYFSSGMKQRLKLAQAFFSDSKVLLLDEPTTNLDAEGIMLYQHLIANYTNNRTIIVSSNDKQEYSFCEQIIAIADYKKP